MSSPSLETSQLGWAGSLTETKRSSSYWQILSSSLLIGGSSLVTACVSIVRNKIVAVFLGPAGVGLMGVLGSMTSLVWTLAAMGITTSGVREIAEAAGSGDQIRMARTATTLRQVVVRLGGLGALLLAVFSVPVSRVTFGDSDHAITIVVLSLVILASAVNEGQLARLQGFRRIGDLARASVASAALTLALTVPAVYVWREDAVVPLLVLASLGGVVSSWWYARRIPIAQISMKWREAMTEARPWLRLGLASMSSAVLAAAIAYVVRIVIARQLGFEAAGIFQAATTLSSVYCGFILSAMAADFLPRLSAVAEDDATCNRLVNEQVEVGLLLALPGICGTLAFSPLIVQLLYSPQFEPATDVLRWQVIGTLLRVASWPMGYMLLAKGRARLYFWTELSYNLLYLALIWIGVSLWGLPGAGIAFFGLYVYYCALMCVVTRRLSGFTWSPANRRLTVIAIPAVVCVFVSPMILSGPWQFIAAGAVTALAGLSSFRSLLMLPGNHGIRQALLDRLPQFARRT